MARMIDGDVVTERLRGWLESPHGKNVYNSGYDDAIWHVLDVIEHIPTLTQPNEPTYPCDLCVYNPPSSLGGKPCTFCPATGRPPEGEEDT